MLKLNGIAELRARVGQQLGTSDWHEVTQPRIDAFASATGDFEHIHVDPERGRQGGFESTIAHGLYTLSLGPRSLYEIYSMSGHALALNYGYDRVRFVRPVLIGDTVTVTYTIAERDDDKGEIRSDVMACNQDDEVVAVAIHILRRV